MQWFYKDPNGTVQGPFPADDMFEWNSMGYFKDDLLVRRSIDREFTTLGKTLARYGTDPFKATKHPPTLKPKEVPVSAPTPPQQQAPAAAAAPPASQQPAAAPPAAAAPMAQAGLQSIAPAPQQDPIHQVIFLIRSQPQYADMYRQFMIQIQSLDQYKVTCYMWPGL